MYRVQHMVYLILVAVGLLQDEAIDPVDLERDFRAAAYFGDVDFLRDCLSKGVDLDCTAALGRAVWGGRADAVRFLLAQGADANDTDSFGNSFLMVAADAGVVRELLAGGADVHLENKAGWTAMMRAERVVIRTKLAEFADIRALLAEAGATFDDGDRFRHELDLMDAAQWNLDRQAGNDIAEGARVDAADDEGYTALMYAAKLGNRRVLGVLLRHGADPDATNLEGSTGLMLASREGHLETVRDLLRHGANVNAKDLHGRTALSGTVWARNKQVADLLLKHGAKAPPGWTTMGWPKHRG